MNVHFRLFSTDVPLGKVLVNVDSIAWIERCDGDYPCALFIKQGRKGYRRIPVLDSWDSLRESLSKYFITVRVLDDGGSVAVNISNIKAVVPYGADADHTFIVLDFCPRKSGGFVASENFLWVSSCIDAVLKK